MGATPDFEFEPAPELPGSDRACKYGFGAVRRLANRMWDLEVEGRDLVPRDGPAIITPNHLSFCDSVFVPSALPRRVWAIGKGEYMDSWKTKHVFPAMGMIPVDRSGGDAAQAALDTAASVLDGGHLFMIYPEGTRSRSGNLHKGRTGAARLAIRCDAPIVPVGHHGTIEVQTPDAVMMKPFKKVQVKFGAPMWAKDFGDLDDPRTLRRFTDAVMFEIAALSGQEYVDTYASKKSAPKPERTDRLDRPDDSDSASGPDGSASEQIRVAPSRPSTIGASPTLVPRPPGARPTGTDAPLTMKVTVPAGRSAAVPASASRR